MDYGSSSERLASALRPELRQLAPGKKVPSQRELVRRFGVSASTVAHALARLAQEGLIESRPGAGAYRADAMAAAPVGDTSWQQTALELGADQEKQSARSFDASGLLGTFLPRSPEVVDLNGGYLHPDIQPAGLLNKAMARAARRADIWDRPPPGGLPELRDWFASEIGGGLSRQDVLICGAGQEALSSALRGLARPGDPVILESPSYPGTAAVAQAAGIRPVPVALDREGIIPQQLDQALARSGSRLVVLQPLFQNPTGISISSGRAREVLEIARSHGAFVLEDDFARYMQHAGAPPVPPPLVADDPDGVVVHIRSLTKATSPNLRVGAIVGHGPVMARLRACLVIDAFLVSALVQITALEVVTAPGWRRSQAEVAKNLRRRREVAVKAVTETFGASSLRTVPSGGYHLWVSLPGNVEATHFAAAALAEGICVTAGDNYYAGGGAPPHIRLSYVAAPAVADVDAGIRGLGRILRG